MSKNFSNKKVTKKEAQKAEEQVSTDEMRLNKYMAHAGIASRRQSAEFIKAGEVLVNGEVNVNPGYKVLPTDKVEYKNKLVKPVEDLYYLLLNKPKDMITTRDDENGRRTVMDIVPKQLEKIIYPVGRLDRMTTGLLLLTNDGELAHRMMHPRYELSKVYEVTLNEEIPQQQIKEIAKGITLEDGPVIVDAINYVHDRPKNEVAVELHLGRNRIVRRIFEHFGYQVQKLDRTRIGNLTKKDLSRGRFRHLTAREIIMLKHF